MTRRAVLAILALIAGFVVSGPVPATTSDVVVAVSSSVEAAHLPGAPTRLTTAHPVQQHGLLGKPLDGVQPPVHVTPVPPVREDVVHPAHRVSPSDDRVPLGERAPPVTSGS
ncbi:hypothetical protein [Actinosynnema sp. NPDC020468]|uniref:hypothetical protein n=1 Tax=Actinosynnema sp. NPDC020468 TaxID=3154488 RepID=UPI0033E36911